MKPEHIQTQQRQPCTKRGTSRRLLQVINIFIRFMLVPYTKSKIFRSKDAGLGKNIRLGLEQLGAFYIKFGQFLTMRQDIIAPEITSELENLLENTPTLKFQTIREAVETALGNKIETLFAEFDETPIGSASIAQVHKAKLWDGQEVAVKIRRPGLIELFETDLKVLGFLARIFDGFGAMAALEINELIEQFRFITKKELDFRDEFHAAVKLRKRAPEGIYIPKTYPELSTDAVITIEYIDGLSLLSLINLAKKGDTRTIRAVLPHYDPEKILLRLTKASLKQIFIDGFYHGDPHPGNIIAMPDGKVAFIDFGIIGRLTAHDRKMFSGYVEHLSMGNFNKCYQYLSRIYVPTKRSDELSFRKEVIQTLSQWHHSNKSPYSEPSERHIGRAFDRVLVVVRQHHYKTALFYILFWRTLIVLDSIALKLSPQFDLTRATEEYFREISPKVSERLNALLKRRNASEFLSGPGFATASSGMLFEPGRSLQITHIRKEQKDVTASRNGTISIIALAIFGTAIIPLLLLFKSHFLGD